MEYLKNILKKTGWISILESIIFAILGIIIILNPEGIVKIMSYILGIMFIVAGISKAFNYFSNKSKLDFNDYSLVYGAMACILGIVIMACSSTIGSIFRIAIGIWIIYSSFMRINFSIRLKSLNSKIWIYSLVLAIIMLIGGLYITLNQGAVMVTIGVLMIIYSVIDIAENIIFIYNLK